MSNMKTIRDSCKMHINITRNSPTGSRLPVAPWVIHFPESLPVQTASDPVPRALDKGARGVYAAGHLPVLAECRDQVPHQFVWICPPQ